MSQHLIRPRVLHRGENEAVTTGTHEVDLVAMGLYLGVAAFFVCRVTGNLTASDTTYPSDSKATAANASNASMPQSLQK